MHLWYNNFYQKNYVSLSHILLGIQPNSKQISGAICVPPLKYLLPNFSRPSFIQILIINSLRPLFSTYVYPLNSMNRKGFHSIRRDDPMACLRCFPSFSGIIVLHCLSISENNGFIYLVHTYILFSFNFRRACPVAVTMTWAWVRALSFVFFFDSSTKYTNPKIHVFKMVYISNCKNL